MKSRALQRSASGTPDGRAQWTRRVILGGLGTAGASIALAALAASAFANAANPISTSATVSPPDANGHVTVTVSGRWSWGELGTTQSSPQNDCAGRSGVGWSVDWWGMSTSQTAKANPPALTGSLVNPTTSKTVPPSPTSGGLNPTQVWQVKSGASTGLYFHTTQDFNGFEANLCPKTPTDLNGNPDITLDSKGAPSGSWSAWAIYPSASDVPPLICANFYDPHGSRGSYSTSTSDNTTADGDNSIKTNNFDPANVQGNCAVPVVQNALSITVDKFNNADQTAPFTTSEQANSLTQNVDFRVVVKNTSANDTAIIQSGITDTFSGTTINVCDGSTVGNVVLDDNIVGVPLAPGASTTCNFTLKNYVPTTGSKSNTVTVTAKDQQAPAITATDDGTSIVTAPNPQPTLSAYYRLCSDDTVVLGGSFHTPIGDVNDKLDPTGLNPGTYSVSTKAIPPGYVIVSCTSRHGYNGETSLSATLPPNAELDFYLAPGIPGIHATKDGPAVGVAGGQGVYTITVTNTSNQFTAGNPVVFYDQLPVGETYVSGSATQIVIGANGSHLAVNPNLMTCATTPGNPLLIACQYNHTLAPGASAKVDVTIQYANNVDGKVLTDCVGTTPANAQPGVANPNDQCVPTQFGNPGVLVKKSGPATGLLNGQGTYTIVATNFGDAISPAQPWTDTLPAGEAFDAQHSSPGCSVTNQVITCSLNSLAIHGNPGDSQSFTIVVTYTQTGLQTDCATIAGQLVPSCVTTRVVTPSISVVKTNDANGDGAFHDSETAKNPGDAVAFHAVVTNNSDATIIVDSLNDAFSGITVDLAQYCPQLIGAVMAPGEQLSCTFTLANYAPAAGDSLTNTITVLGHEPNSGTPVSDTDTSTVTTKQPTPGPDLAIVKDADKATVHVGDTLTYTLAVSNVGQGATTGAVTVTDTIPGGLDPVSVDGGTAWDCALSGQDISCTYLNGALNPGDAAPLITVVTTVNSTAVGVVINTGVVDTPGDVNPANNRSTVKTPVIKVLPLKVIKTPPAVLPFTGDRTGAMLPVGVLTVLAGALLTVAGRRRRRTC